MAKKIAVNNLNATTIQILNVIRQNASAEYQSLVPEVTKETDIPKVGEYLVGYPALANQFLSALINRIAAVRIKSAVFNNPFVDLKKGFLGMGETIEEAFVSITKAMEFSAEKAEAREFKRYLPDVKAAFHSINWRVVYPLTIERQQLERAFLSVDGVTDMIAKIVESIYTSASYDDYLLAKYLIIKSVSKGQMHPVAVDTANIKNAAVSFRGVSNQLTFMGKGYNAAGVTTTTPREDQVIFMDSFFNAQYDVEILSAAFSMDKATFMGQLHLIDSWSDFDNDRFSVIMGGSDQIEEVTTAELTLMKDVIAVVADREFFQIYDVLSQMTDKEVASGLYWNYFYHTWKIVSSSPFSNAVVFVKDSANTAAPSSINLEVLDKSVSDDAVILTLAAADSTRFNGGNLKFVQTEDLTEAGVAVHPYGALIIPSSVSTAFTIEVETAGEHYTSTSEISKSSDVGDSFTLSKTSTI